MLSDKLLCTESEYDNVNNITNRLIENILDSKLRSYISSHLRVQDTHLIWTLKQDHPTIKMRGKFRDMHVTPYLWAMHMQKSNHGPLIKLCNIQGCVMPYCYKERKMSDTERLQYIEKNSTPLDERDCLFFRGRSKRSKIKIDGVMTYIDNYICDQLHPATADCTEIGHSCFDRPHTRGCVNKAHLQRVSKNVLFQQRVTVFKKQAQANSIITARNNWIRQIYAKREMQQRAIARRFFVSKSLVQKVISKKAPVASQRKYISKFAIRRAFLRIMDITGPDSHSSCLINNAKTVSRLGQPMSIVAGKRYRCIDIMYAFKNNILLPLQHNLTQTCNNKRCILDSHIQKKEGKLQKKTKIISALQKKRIIEIFASRISMSIEERMQKYGCSKTQLYRLDSGKHYSLITGATKESRKLELSLTVKPDKRRLEKTKVGAKRQKLET